MKIVYRPHVVNTIHTPFIYTVPKALSAVDAAAALHAFQIFMGEENHSCAPYKARIEFHSNIDLISPQHDRLVEDFNDHHLLNSRELPYFDLKGTEFDNQLAVYYFPQVPCKPFHWPVDTPEQAYAVINMLAAYDEHLLTKCSGMRVDYSNMAGVTMVDPDEPNEWVDFYFEKDGDFFESIDEYMEHFYPEMLDTSDA